MKYARICILAAAVAAALPVAAQKAPRSVWPKEPDAVFGLRLGERLDWEQIPDCVAPPSKEPPKFSFCKLMGSTSTNVSLGGFGVLVMQGGSLDLDDDGVATKLSVIGKHEDYREIKDILVERYGPPTLTTKGEVKTRAGASLHQEQLTWVGKKIGIVLRERSGDADTTSIVFAYIPAAERGAAQRRQNVKTDASKL